MRKLLVSLCLASVFLGLTIATYAQNKNLCVVKGNICDEATKETLFGVVATIPEINVWYVTDSKGNYILDNIPAGKYIVYFTRMGLQDKQVEVELKPGDNRIIDMKMLYLSLAIDEIVVTAKENPNQLSTSSLIESQAIEHIQASSLGDLMQLLPGQVSENPDLNSRNQASLRSSTSDPDNNKIDAYGTAIVMDGAPMSNNANLQVTNTAQIGAEGYFSTVSGGGVDLRQIPTDNIESVEIIRGIPSVKHGDLTSGAIIVNTKAGVTPFIGKIKFNPNTKQVYLGKGVKLRNNLGSVNADFDYAYSQSDVRLSSPSYNRVTGKLTYSNTLFDHKLYTTTKLSVFRTYDEDRDKDGTSLEKRYSEDQGLRFTTSGKVRIKKALSNCINYNVTVDYKNQESYSRILKSGSITPLATSLINETYEAIFLPSEYYTGYYIDGNPFNLFANIDNNFHFKLGTMKNKVMLGINYTIDANWGDGKYFDENYYSSSSLRPVSFKNIPALHQLSFYIEDMIRMKLFSKNLRIQAGLRFDNVQPINPIKGEFGQVLLPRINLTYSLLDNLTIRGGYGITSKAPSLIYLYPDPAYFDALSYNMYSSTYSDESMAVITTKVFHPDNSQMRPSEMTKIEGGLAYKIKRNSINITVYSEDLKGGYSFKDILALTPYPQYEIYSYTPGLGEQPTLDYTNVDTATLRDNYKIPVNTKNIKRKGVEMTINTSKIDVIGTSFNFSGAWSLTETSDETDDIFINSQYYPGNDNKYIGVYESNGYESENLTSTLRIIQHIPRLQFVASLAIQTQWIQKQKTNVNNQYPIAYIDTDGNEFRLTEEQSYSAEYAYLVKQYDKTYFYDSDRPIVWHMSLKLTKELKNNMSFSFYANNMFMNHPKYMNYKTGTIEKLNSSLFFGAELNFKL
ncbi:MAG: TonB-dependent receptor plug domain-containing protein [Bacteroidales bacterium]|nr:TonB-dependent receptor plug domain-containing protein [Bacteroidales bacterium]